MLTLLLQTMQSTYDNVNIGDHRNVLVSVYSQYSSDITSRLPFSEPGDPWRSATALAHQGRTHGHALCKRCLR